VPDLSIEDLDHLPRVLRSTLRSAIRKGGADTGPFVAAPRRTGAAAPRRPGPRAFRRSGPIRIVHSSSRAVRSSARRRARRYKASKHKTGPVGGNPDPPVICPQPPTSIEVHQR